MSLPILLLDFLPPQILDILTSTKIYTKILYNPERQGIKVSFPKATQPPISTS